MNHSLKNETAIREYLLGRVADETRLAEFEELLFLDEEFTELAELAEDALINDFVFEKLDEKTARAFSKTLQNNAERRAKVQLTQALKEKAKAVEPVQTEFAPSFFDALKAFFKKPLNIGVFAVVLLAVFGLSWVLLNRSAAGELAELKSIYKQERPVEARISEFDYAPLAVTRGAQEDRERSKLRRLENDLLEAVEKNPSARAHHALGVFYLTQRKFAEAVGELEKSVKTDDKNARMLNDLGSAYFEKAKIEEPEKRLETLAKALENFGRAVETDPAFLPALFNKALCLQELKLESEAREAWQKYLEKDDRSGWSDEARKNLERLKTIQQTSKTKEQILEDFLTAFRSRDADTAWRINSETREMISGVWLADQLSARFLEAKVRGDQRQADESLNALRHLGDLEKNDGDRGTNEMADFYSKAAPEKFPALLKAKQLVREGHQLTPKFNYRSARDNFTEARTIFSLNGNIFEEIIADYWIAFCEIFINQTSQTEQTLRLLEKKTFEKDFLWLRSIILARLGNYYFLQNDYSAGFTSCKTALRLAQKVGDVSGQQKITSEISYFYLEIGETESSLAFLSKNFSIDKQYFQSPLASWRNYGNYFDLLKELNYKNAAHCFLRENLHIAREYLPDTGLPIETSISLVEAQSMNGQYQKAVELAKTNQSEIDKLPDREARLLKTAYSNRQIGDNHRLSGDCENALIAYRQTVEQYLELRYESIDKYFAHKGRLVCYKKLKLWKDFENELSIVNGLFEKYRREILEEENRNAFFGREQTVTNLVTEYFLEQNDFRKAFETAESSKSRSLLDLLEKKGSFDQAAQQVTFQESGKSLMIDEIRKDLPPQVQIVQYAVLEEKIVVWLISSERFEFATVDVSADEVEKKISVYLESVKTRAPQTRQLSSELFDILIKPVSSKLAKDRQLCLIPDGVLFQLPFASLFSSANSRYLIEDFTLLYAPSSSVFVRLSQKALAKPKTERLLAVGNPEFDALRNPALQSLKSAENEVRELGKFYRQTNEMLGRAAVKPEILKNLGRTDIFHFAGHYVANRQTPRFSKMMLTPLKNESDEFDGELRAYEILQLTDLNLKLAVLSACETAVEGILKGEGAIGIARIFLAAGTPIVVASQWNVESDSTAELMISFHRHRKTAGLTVTEALRRAQIELLAVEKFREPYFWAAFSPVGGFVEY